MAEPVFFQHFQVDQKPEGGLWELGRGAMGITYKAFDTNLQCPVALKIINATLTDNVNARERFLREARAAARLRHPNVATVLHLGKDDQSYFYAMEFIEGETLEAHVARHGPLPPVRALELVQQVARALGAAQNEGLVHRDIKPANLMLVRYRGEADDEGVHVKVIDFGLAKFIEKGGTAPDSLNLTMAGGFVGSPYFASPEQVDEGVIDTRSDIYSLGATLWFLLAGEPPFTGSLGQVLSQHLQRPPPYDTLTARGVPAPVLDLLRRMLAKAPEDRPADPIVLRREVSACLRALGAPAGSSAGSKAGARVSADSDPPPAPTETSYPTLDASLGQTALTLAGPSPRPESEPPVLPPPTQPPVLPVAPVPPPLPPGVPPGAFKTARPAAVSGAAKSCLLAGALVGLALIVLAVIVVGLSYSARRYRPAVDMAPAVTPRTEPDKKLRELTRESEELRRQAMTPSVVPQTPPPPPPPFTPPPPPSPASAVYSSPPPVYSPPPRVAGARPLPVLPNGTRALASYRARLSERDHHSSTGERLDNIADILRQDRANYYRFAERDPEDEGDPLFADATQRARLGKANLRYLGNREVFLNGTPYVQVDVYPNGVVVSILSR